MVGPSDSLTTPIIEVMGELEAYGYGQHDKESSQASQNESLTG
jgi:hypothetical protein